MARYRYSLILAATALAGAAVMAAARPAAFAQAAPGMWEISGYPGSKAPARECIGDPSSGASLWAASGTSRSSPNMSTGGRIAAARW